MKKLWLKKNLLIGLVVLVVALVGAGAAVPVMAQTGNENGPVNTDTGVYLDTPTLGRLAGALGIQSTDLITQLQVGRTLATIAKVKDISTATLVDAIIAPYIDEVALELKYGYITQEQSQAFLDTARQQANYILGQNLSVAPSSHYGYYGQNGGYWMGGYMPGYGWGMMGSGYGWGMMSPGYGSGMMVPGYGWGGYNNNQTPAPGSSPTPGIGGGGGMMGGGETGGGGGIGGIGGGMGGGY